MKNILKVILLLDRGLTKLEEYVLSYSIILISVMVIGNVVSRNLFGVSWQFHEEIARYAVVLATFMGITYAARKGRHLRMTAITDLAPWKVRKILAIVIPALTAVVLIVLGTYAISYLIELQQKGRTTTYLQIPIYIMLIYTPVGLFLGALQYLRNMWINFRKEEIYIATEKLDHSET